MVKTKRLNKIRARRKKRVKANIFGTAEKPRLSIFRSNRYTYFQLINDDSKKTLVSGSTRELIDKKQKTTKQNSAEKLGELIAKKAVDKGIKKVVVDRGRYKYHGRVKTVAEGAKKGGLKL
jgi:large subunit ribosomal protein L18